MAEKGNTAAQSLLGVAYLHGQGVPADKSIAAHWLLRAAEGGEATAAGLLGSLYERGQGVERDPQKPELVVTVRGVGYKFDGESS